MVTIIPPGETAYIRNKEYEKIDGCGFLSFVPLDLTTTGFKWNVTDNDIEILFGKYISSSN